MIKSWIFNGFVIVSLHLCSEGRCHVVLLWNFVYCTSDIHSSDFRSEKMKEMKKMIVFVEVIFEQEDTFCDLFELVELSTRSI